MAKDGFSTEAGSRAAYQNEVGICHESGMNANEARRIHQVAPRGF